VRTAPEFPALARRDTTDSRLLLRINDKAILWSSGRFARGLAEELRRRSPFARIHYPVAPEQTPDFSADVRSSARVDSHLLYNYALLPLLGVLTVGAAFALSTREDLHVRSEVVLSGGQGELARFEVATRTRLYRPQLTDRASLPDLDAPAVEQAALHHARAIALEFDRALTAAE
jgi:hypothetical protein